VPDGMLVRISSLSPDVAGSYAAHDGFMRELLESLQPAARQRIAGLSAQG
jgi:hypothetical protein